MNQAQREWIYSIIKSKKRFIESLEEDIKKIQQNFEKMEQQLNREKKHLEQLEEGLDESYAKAAEEEKAKKLAKLAETRLALH